MVIVMQNQRLTPHNAVPMTLSAGTHLGPYEIVSLIGAGGMGEVYKARDTHLERAIAIKVLLGHLSDRPELRERFEREARAVASLNHPHICVLHDIGIQDGAGYMVMEYMEGETLAARIEKARSSSIRRWRLRCRSPTPSTAPIAPG